MLLMAAAVFLFLIVAGVPAFSQLNENETTAKEAGSITDHLQFAHQEAIRRGLPVTVCASGDGETCNDAGKLGRGLHRLHRSGWRTRRSRQQRHCVEQVPQQWRSSGLAEQPRLHPISGRRKH